jgi:hypothetical protein
VDNYDEADDFQDEKNEEEGDDYKEYDHGIEDYYVNEVEDE